MTSTPAVTSDKVLTNEERREAERAVLGSKTVYLCYRTNNKRGANGVAVKMFYGFNAAMIYLRAFEGTLIELRKITAERPDGIVIAQAVR